MALLIGASRSADPRAWWTNRAIMVLLMLVAVGLGYAAARQTGTSAGIAVVICGLPLVPILFVRPDIAALATCAILPFERNIAPASVGVEVAAADLLLAVTLAGLIYRYAVDIEARRQLAQLRPVVPIAAIYVAAAFIVTAAHPSHVTAINLAQRLEIVVVPLLAGATLFTLRTARAALLLFLAAGLLLGTAVLLAKGNGGSFLGVQKNPAGQYVADAALVSLAVIRRLPLRYLLFAYLLVCLIASQSRGALLGMLVALAIYITLTCANPLQFVLRVVLAAAVVVGVYALLPHGEQQRLTGRAKTTSFNDSVRRDYAKDAEKIIGEHPYVGVGIGNYLAGDPNDLTQTNDPHNVILLETAEGGYLLMAAFVILQLGGLVLVLRRLRGNRWAVVAVAVQVAILTHALVDVYWVRGTPVMGWLLIGLALSQTARSSPDSESDVQLRAERPGRGTHAVSGRR